ncbi:MAG: hypothetical protein JKX97_08170 [Candidatus Lindowbacteria bacterium]|nr:hypothetical protein [Candidatus Lindowbacteria bacterium]
MPQTWKQILEDEGFRRTYFPAESSHALGQQIIVSESDGIVLHQASASPSKSAPVKTRIQSVANFVQDILLEKLAESLEVPRNVIAFDESFADYGMDSIIGVNLVDSINERLGIEMPVTTIFDKPTLNELADFIESRYGDEITNDSLPFEERTIEVPTIVAAAERSISSEKMRDPIAIIGMSGRFAKSDDVNELWQNLEKGVDLVSEADRWDLSELKKEYREDGLTFCSKGSYLDEIDRFDPAFFKISRVEATYMDPQQRLFLEEAWKSLEDAGYAGASV